MGNSGIREFALRYDILRGGKLSCTDISDLFLHGPAGQHGKRGELLYCGDPVIETNSGCGRGTENSGALFCG